MKWILCVALVLAIVSIAGTPPRAAGASTRFLWFSATVDYGVSHDNGIAHLVLDGMVFPAIEKCPKLDGLPFVESPQLLHRDTTCFVRGVVEATWRPPTDGDPYHRFDLKPIDLEPGDLFTVVFGLADVDYGRVSPKPENLKELEALDADDPISTGMNFIAPTERKSINLSVAVIPIVRQIDITVTPVVGEMLQSQPDSFRLSGQITLDQLSNADFGRLCQVAPLTSNPVPFGAAYTLFALDTPPQRHGGLLSSIYQHKPVFTLVRTDLVSCRVSGGTGQVVLNFTGRVKTASAALANMVPRGWFANDTVESNTATEEGTFELVMGEVVLGPSESLRLRVPGARIVRVSPSPDSLIADDPLDVAMQFRGPARFSLVIEYQPTANLVAGQLPSIARGYVSGPEQSLRPIYKSRGFSGFSFSPGTATSLVALVAIFSGIVLVSVSRLGVNYSIRLWPSQRYVSLQMGAALLMWSAAGVVLLYGFRGSYGLIALGILVVPMLSSSMLRDWRAWALAGAGVTLTFFAMSVDAYSERFFTELSTLELGSTPFTATILIALAALLAVIAQKLRLSGEIFEAPVVFAVVVVLTVFVVFNDIQGSLLSYGLLMVGSVFVYRRLTRIRANGAADNGSHPIRSRVVMAMKNRMIFFGTVILAAFAFQNGFASSSAIFNSADIGIWGAMFAPALLFLSILLSYTALGLIFLILYPVLPFQKGVPKAIAFGLFFVLLFALGVGADDRLVTVFNELIIGRLVFFLGVPLLIGIHREIEESRRTDQEGEEMSFYQAGIAYISKLNGSLSIISALMSMIAPTSYAVSQGLPLVVSYVDIVGKLLELSTAI